MFLFPRYERGNRSYLNQAIKNGLYGPFRQGYLIEISTLEGIYDIRKSIPWAAIDKLTRNDKIDLVFSHDLSCTDPLTHHQIIALDRGVLRKRRNLVAVLQMKGKNKLLKPHEMRVPEMEKWAGNHFLLAIRLMEDALDKVKRSLPSHIHIAPALQIVTSNKPIVKEVKTDDDNEFSNEPRDIMKELFGSSDDEDNVNNKETFSSTSSSSSDTSSSSSSSSSSDDSSSDEEDNRN